MVVKKSRKKGVIQKKITLDELGEMMTHVVTHMSTKDDIAELQATMATKVELEEVKTMVYATASELAEVKDTINATASELRIVRRDVEEIKEKVESHEGFTKEIDYVLSRVVVVERRVGIAQ